MKSNIHPNYHEVEVTCACGEKFICGSTADTDTLKIGVCNKCHPFYTGKQKKTETGGRIDRFNKKFGIKG